jgi:hypothetical protein
MMNNIFLFGFNNIYCHRHPDHPATSSCSASTIFIAIAIQIIQPQVHISIVFQPSIFWGNWDTLLSSEPFCCTQFIQKQG